MKEFLLILVLNVIFATSAFGQKQVSDRAAEGLRGNVKSVVIEASSASGKSARVVMSKLTFHADGNLNTREDYGPAGDLLTSSSYSFLEGERVVKMETIYPPNMVVLGDPTKTKRSSDPRYTYKIRYKFDSLGRRTEAAWLRSDDSIYLKYRYSYNGNSREELIDFDNGLTIEKKVSTLDRRGNVLEVFHRDPSDNSLLYKETYSYLKFDRQGNWIKRVETQQRRNAPVTSIIVARTITYH
jgi:hypothetical protein